MHTAHAALALALSLALPTCALRRPSTPAAARSAPPASPAAAPTAAGSGARPDSPCALPSREALCQALREHYLSSGNGWVADGCAWGETRTTSGPFAEVGIVAVREGYGTPDGGARVDRPLLDGSVREPAGATETTTHLLLAARVGTFWFPLQMFFPRARRIRDLPVEWSVEEGGAYVVWSDVSSESSRGEPDGYGEVTRQIAVVDHGVPKLAARAAVDHWVSRADLACTRACNTAPNPPAYPGCEQRCASGTRATRTWERTGATLRVGATVVDSGDAAVGEGDVEREPAFVRRLDVADHWLDFCAFVPVVHAVAPTTPPADSASVAARAAGLAALRSRRLRALHGAAALVEPGAPRATLEVFATQGGGCGGGGCTTGVSFRTLRGEMPEHGVDYFAQERGARVGCDDATLPSEGSTSYVEVAPARGAQGVGCGFSGFDGTTRRYWVVTGVFETGR